MAAIEEVTIGHEQSHEYHYLPSSPRVVDILNEPDEEVRAQLMGMAAQDLLEQGIRCKREEIICVDDIVLDASVAVSMERAADLASNMYGEEDQGQDSTITVRPKLIDDPIQGSRIIYEVADGYHRSVVTLEQQRRERQQEPTLHRTLRATVAYGWTDDELVAQRILNSNNVRTVQFARIAAWVTEAWQKTPWAARGLTPVQAFSIGRDGRGTSYLANLTPEEVLEVQAWVDKRTQEWNKKVTFILPILRIAQDASPSLISQVRIASGGKDRIAVLTQDRLGAIADAFPGELHWHIQEKVAEFILQERLSSDQTAFLAEAATRVIFLGMDDETITQQLKEIKIPEDTRAERRRLRVEREVREATLTTRRDLEVLQEKLTAAQEEIKRLSTNPSQVSSGGDNENEAVNGRQQYATGNRNGHERATALPIRQQRRLNQPEGSWESTDGLTRGDLGYMAKIRRSGELFEGMSEEEKLDSVLHPTPLRHLN